MNRTVIRATFVGAGAAGILAVILAACGGGGGGSSAPSATVAAPVTAPSMNPVQTNNFFTGPSSQVSVSIKLPARNGTAAMRAKLKAQYGGSILNNPHLRTMANTSPTASLRALGKQESVYAQQVQKSTGRKPDYVSGYVDTLEFVLSSGATVLVDDTIGCSEGQCTGTFTVPVGSNYTVTIYVYDTCPFLLAAGVSPSPVTIAAGYNTPLTITLNPLAAYFYISPSTSSVIADPSEAQNINVSGWAYDADGDQLTTPGVLLDSNFYQITGFTMGTDGPDVSLVSNNPAPVNGDLSYGPFTFAFAGTGTESQIDFTATEINNGTPYVPDFYTAGSPDGTDTTTSTVNFGDSVADNPVQLIWTGPTSYTMAAADAPQFTTIDGIGSPGSVSVTQLELPTLNESGTVTMGLSATAPNYSGNVTLTDNGNCTNVAGYTTGAQSYQTIASNLVLTTYNVGSPVNNCTITATVDNAGSQEAALNVYYDQTNLTITNKARKH